MLRLGRGDHVHLRARMQVAEDPFDVAGGAEPAGGVTGVAYPQHAELHRRFTCHVHPQLARDAVLLVLVDAVAEAMAHAIRAVAGAGQRGRRPEPPGLLVADIERLAAGVADRVVVPGREPELMSILRPRIAGVRFAGHDAEPGIGQYVRPRRRRRLSLRQVDHVLVAVRGERAEAVAFAQRRGGWIDRPRIGARAVADVILP